MDIKELEQTIINALEEIKARDIEVIDTSRNTPLFERIIVASAETSRQTRALARNVHEKVREAGGDIISLEGEDSGEWILVDTGDIIVHVMQPAVRAHYNLEELWSAKPSAPRKGR